MIDTTERMNIKDVHTPCGTLSIKYLKDYEELKSFLVGDEIDKDIEITEKKIRDNWPAIYGTCIKNEVMPKNTNENYFHTLLIWFTDNDGSTYTVGYIYKIKEDKIFKLTDEHLASVLLKYLNYKNEKGLPFGY